MHTFKTHKISSIKDCKSNNKFHKSLTYLKYTKYPRIIQEITLDEMSFKTDTSEPFIPYADYWEYIDYNSPYYIKPPTKLSNKLLLLGHYSGYVYEIGEFAVYYDTYLNSRYITIYISAKYGGDDWAIPPHTTPMLKIFYDNKEVGKIIFNTDTHDTLVDPSQISIPTNEGNHRIKIKTFLDAVPPGYVEVILSMKIVCLDADCSRVTQ